MSRLFLLLTLLVLPGTAFAYPDMIRHGYTGCAQCHTDPSGGGALTAYGRAQTEVLLAMPYGTAKEPGKEAEFLFGALSLPEALALQADVRSVLIPRPGALRYILMQADLRGAVSAGAFRAGGSLGAVSEGARMARVTTGDTWNAVSREHWLGVAPTDAWLVRAGRMNLPFGLRTDQHLLDPRVATRTDTNEDQQHGLAVAWEPGFVRAEVMGIAGNFQVSPDAFRERGAAGYAAVPIGNELEFGVSGLYATSKADVNTLQARTRQAYGFFGRAGVGPVALLGEGDLLFDRQTASATGGTGFLQVDWEAVQGLHVLGTGEWCDGDLGDGTGGVPTATVSLHWFAWYRADLRIDGMRGVLYCTPGASPEWMGLANLHFML
jgi:hypothetical protein